MTHDGGYDPNEMFCRGHTVRSAKECFTTYGGSCLDTPVFKCKDVLTDKYGKYGKDSYNLMDQGRCRDDLVGSFKSAAGDKGKGKECVGNVLV